MFANWVKTNVLLTLSVLSCCCRDARVHSGPVVSHRGRVLDRKALLDIRAQKTDVRHQLQPEEQQEPEDEEELDVATEGAESEGEEELAETWDTWDTWDGQIPLSNHQEKTLLRFSSSPVGGAPNHFQSKNVPQVLVFG